MDIKILRLLFFIGLLNLPGIIGSIYLTILFILIYLGVFFSGLASQKVILLQKQYNKPLRFVYIYLIIILISYFRAYEFSVFKILSYLSFTLFIIYYLSEVLSEYYRSETSPIDTFRAYIISPFTFYIALNFVCWILNLKIDNKSNNEVEIGPAVVLSSFGYAIERVNFLFSKGINGYAVMLGAISSYFTLDMILNKKWSAQNIILYTTLIISILLTDARSAIAFPIMILIVCYSIMFLNLKFVIRIGAYLFIGIPIIAVIFIPLLAEIEFFNQFARSDSDLFTLNGRLFIWFFAVDEFINFKLIHLVGYGFEGHVSSGASQNWSFLFASFSNPEAVHPHNSLLSITFDLGYTGILLVLIILNQVSSKLTTFYTKNKKEALTFFSLLLYIILISVTESFLTDLYMNGLVLILSYFLFVLSLRTEENVILN